ncbi:branched-chain amino acid ABC transporter permea se [Desulfonema ishimotonii]|uniref:Branched-chain amino acid ABC transporter permea se n=1 Tax=Desulfonema ishimotonii TaxID=45657 RepID=A0A401FXG5_9BACT|nr:branched-chain amino acid ABC transporter permease [Desulfonema ishimotonii]GBC61678.1 branched-chain amino acid ABC transporter permea se [Desulfonema ishimotonii]
MVKKDYFGLCALALGVAGTPLLIQNDYYLGILVFTALNCLACTGLSLLMGYAGQISMGNAAFVGLGAYTSAILTVRLGWNPWLAMLAGVLLVLAIAMLIGIPSLRLKGHYLGMATLGFGSIVHIVSVAATGLTGGPEGINDIPPLGFGSILLDSDLRFFYFSWAVLILGLFLALNLIHSRIGRGLRSVHGSEDAAESVGVDTAAYKIRVFTIGAAYASVSGSLYASYVSYIDPGPFDVMHSVLMVTMVAVGGMHNVWGAVIGAALLSVLPEALSSASEYFEFIGVAYDTDYDMLIYGGILLSIMLFLPGGLLDGLARLIRLPGKLALRLKGGTGQNG